MTTLEFNMQMQTKEKLALLLMSDDDESKRVLLFIVYRTIQKNAGITINQLSALLHRNYAISPEQTKLAVDQLSSEGLFNSISTWQEKIGKREIKHLRCKDTLCMDDWLNSYTQRVPETKFYEAPEFIKQVR